MRISCTRWAAALGTGLTLTLALGSPALAAPGTATSSAAGSAKAASGLKTPAGWAARQASVAARSGVSSPAAAAVRRAIDPDDHACGPTQLDGYLDSILGGLTTDQLITLVFSGALDFPTYDALVYGTTGDPRYAITPEYRQSLTRTFGDAQRFWDVSSGDIQLMAMHGDGVLQDPARLTRLLHEVYGLSLAEAVPYAVQVVDLVASLPALQGGNNPIFTLNAFAFSA